MPSSESISGALRWKDKAQPKPPWDAILVVEAGYVEGVQVDRGSGLDLLCHCRFACAACRFFMVGQWLLACTPSANHAHGQPQA